MFEFLKKNELAKIEEQRDYLRLSAGIADDLHKKTLELQSALARRDDELTEAHARIGRLKNSKRIIRKHLEAALKQLTESANRPDDLMGLVEFTKERARVNAHADAIIEDRDRTIAEYEAASVMICKDCLKLKAEHTETVDTLEREICRLKAEFLKPAKLATARSEAFAHPE